MRVIAGRFGGRPLKAPRGRSTRPTSDRVRESLFSILGDLSELRVADLYAGTGALGIEALSRGAAWVTFVESDRAALGVLRENLEALALGPESAVLALPVERCLAGLAQHGPYDLVLCDPPWAEAERALLGLGRLLVGLPLSPHARLVVEHAARTKLLTPPGFPLVPIDRRSWGDTAVSIFQAPA